MTHKKHNIMYGKLIKVFNYLTDKMGQAWSKAA
jgi:hypothetical protein